MNDSRLRFCSKCGNALVLTPSGGSRIAPRRKTWWERHFGSQRRADRRAYRESLPALYRWRPAIVGTLVLSLVAAGGYGVYETQKRDTNKDNPVVDAWYAFNQDAVPLTGVTPVILGSDLARGTSAAALTDGTFVATTMVWQTQNQNDTPCSTPPTIELDWTEATRIRWMAIRPGLPMFDTTRGREYLPAKIEISTGDPHRCVSHDLKPDVERQEFAIDTASDALVDPPTLGKVTALRIAIVSATPPTDPVQVPNLSITEIKLFRMKEDRDRPHPAE